MVDLVSMVLWSSVALVLGVCVALPLWRHRRRTGKLALVVHAGSIERLASAFALLLLIGLVAWTVLYGWLGPEPLALWAAPAWMLWAGLGLEVGGVALIAVAQHQMGTSWRIGIDAKRTPLITGGVFRHVRHPIYTGLIAVVLAAALVTPSPWTLMALLMAIMLVSLEARLEEQHLFALHGEPYARYAGRSGRFVPGIGRLKAAVPNGLVTR